MSKEKLAVKKFQRAPNVIVREEENCYLLVNRTNGKVLVVNKMGLETWHLLESLTVEDATKELARRYGIEHASCKTQIMKFVEKLSKNGFIFP
jgi:hypothetical protein